MRDLCLPGEVFDKENHVEKLKNLKCCHKKVCERCYKIAKNKSGNCYNCGKFLM